MTVGPVRPGSPGPRAGRRCSTTRLVSSPFRLLPLQVVASDGVRAMMESALTARDRVGVQDFVLLENYTSEAAFIENLRKRFKENLIYVSHSFPFRSEPPSA